MAKISTFHRVVTWLRNNVLKWVFKLMLPNPGSTPKFSLFIPHTSLKIRICITTKSRSNTYQKHSFPSLFFCLYSHLVTIHRQTQTGNQGLKNNGKNILPSSFLLLLLLTDRLSHSLWPNISNFLLSPSWAHFSHWNFQWKLKIRSS